MLLKTAKVKRQVIILLCLALIPTAWAQKGKERPIYLDKYLEICKKGQAMYVIDNVQNMDTAYFAQVRAKDGRLKMEGYYWDAALQTENGKFTYYYANGNVESTGHFVMGAKSGLWLRYHADGRSKAEKLYDPHVLSTLVYTKADKMPTYPGGQVEMNKFINENMNVPVSERLPGKIKTTFIVEPDGQLSQVKVVDGINETMNKETVRVLNEMPRWRPGMDKGRSVRVQMMLPVEF